MTIEEKAKAYDEAIKRAKPLMLDTNFSMKNTVISIFPELKEDDDERIRKELIEFIQWSEDRGMTRHDFHQAKRPSEWIAYLEKQKEKKPILEVFGFKVGDAVRLKDGDGRKHIIKSFEEVEGVHGPNFYHVEFEDNSARDSIYPGEEYPNGYYTQMEKFEEEQKPAEWSEKDEEMMDNICGILINNMSLANSDEEVQELKDLLNWVQDLKPRWKPSEEQMKEYSYWYRNFIESGLASPSSKAVTVLGELLEQLEKL